ncbi:putative EMP1-like protein, partial [Plasmodium gaboni]
MGSRGSKFRDDTLDKYKNILPELDGWSYVHYINNLREEIKKQKWNDKTYEEFLKEKGWKRGKTSNPVDRICAWEKVQQDIFRAVMDSYSTTAFTWEEQAKTLLNEARKKHFRGQTCDIFNNNLYDESDKRITKPDTICDSHIVKGLCIPERRKNFDLKDFNKTLYDILSSNHGHVDQRHAISAVPMAIGSLANQVKSSIVDLKTKYAKTNEEICTLMRRTYADAMDILNTKDIYDNKLSINVQCMLKNISNHLIGDSSIDNLMKKYFEEEIEKKLRTNNVYEDDNNTKKCNLDDTSYTKKPQCLRFLEEWFEEFMQKKKIYEER